MATPEQQLISARGRAGTWGRINRNRLRLALKYSKGVVLDLGCGSDAYGARLRDAGFETIGADALAVEPPPRNFVRTLATHLPFRDRAVGTTLLFEVLEHVEDPARTLTEIGRVSDRLVMSVPNCSLEDVLPLTGLVQYHYTDRTHVNFFDESSLCALLESSGWRVLELTLINPVSPGALSLYGWGVPLRVIRPLAPLLKRLPRPRPLMMSIVAVADWSGERRPV